MNLTWNTSQFQNHSGNRNLFFVDLAFMQTFPSTLICIYWVENDNLLKVKLLTLVCILLGCVEEAFGVE